MVIVRSVEYIVLKKIGEKFTQSCTQSPQAFWSAGGHQETLEN